MADPLGPIAEQAADAVRRLRRAAEDTRAAWDDGARTAFDAAHYQPIEAEITNIAVGLAAAASALAAALGG